MLREKSESDNPIMSVLKEMVDFEIMLNPLFVLICISNILGFLAVYVPYVYLPGMTLEKGIDGASTAFIISLIGVSNTVGRVVIGALGPDHLISFRHSKSTCVQNGVMEIFQPMTRQHNSVMLTVVKGIYNID